MAIFAIIVIAAIGYFTIKSWRSFCLSQEIENNVIDKFGEYCKKCSKEYYTCSICGCQFEEEADARRCYQWDLILKRQHTHTYLHDHEDDK